MITISNIVYISDQNRNYYNMNKIKQKTNRMNKINKNN